MWEGVRACALKCPDSQFLHLCPVEGAFVRRMLDIKVHYFRNIFQHEPLDSEWIECYNECYDEVPAYGNMS